MSAPTPPYAPGPPMFQPAASPPPPPPPKKSRAPWIIAATLGVVGVFTAIVVGAAAVGGTKPATPAPAISSADMLPGEDETLPDPAPTTAGPTLTAADVKLTLKVTDKQCFGSAGCNVVAKVQAALTEDFDSADTWQVTYEISGIEDGPLTGTFEVSEGKYDVNEEMFGTKRQRDKPKIKVTGVEKIGY